MFFEWKKAIYFLKSKKEGIVTTRDYPIFQLPFALAFRISLLCETLLLCASALSFPSRPLSLTLPARCLTNFPNGRHNASTFPKSSAVKSAPASIAVAPFRLICITPTTFPSHKIGALTIFCIDSPVVVAAFTPSNTVACRTAEKLLLISGRLSRAVRAASADVLDIGMNPTFFSACGTRKCRCLHRVETPRIATSSVCTPRFFAIFSAIARQRNLHRRSAFHVQRLRQPFQLRHQTRRHKYELSLPVCRDYAGPCQNDSVHSSFMFIAFPASRNLLSNPLCLCYTSFCSGHLQVARRGDPHLCIRSQIPDSAKPSRPAKTCKPFPNSLYWMCCKSLAPFFRAPQKFMGLLRRRGHVLNGNPA